MSVIERARQTANMHEIMLVHEHVFARLSVEESIGMRKVTHGYDKHI